MDLIDASTGQDAIAFVGQTPWHRKGTYMPTPPATTWEAICTAHMNYEVQKKQLHYYAGEGTYERLFPSPIPAPNAYGLVRMDTGNYLATVGKEYHVIQNRDLFAILDPLIQQELVDIEVMGAIRGGSQVWGLCRVKQLPQEVVDRLAMTGDVLRTYIMAFGSHDTTSCLELSNTNVRTVCANTCDLSRLRFPGIKIPHRANALAKLEEAARTLWGNLQVSMLEQAKDAATLRRFAPLSKEQFSIAVLDEIAPAPDAIKKEEYLNWSTYQRARDIVADKRATVRRLWTYGQGHLGDYSAWEAYNGAVEALDHHDRQFRSRDRISSMLNGPIFQAKRNIRTNLLRLAEAA